jgi:hypothetical protein
MYFCRSNCDVNIQSIFLLLLSEKCIIAGHHQVNYPTLSGWRLPTSPRNPLGKLWLFVVDYQQIADSQSTWHFVIYHSITYMHNLFSRFYAVLQPVIRLSPELDQDFILTTSTLIPRGCDVRHLYTGLWGHIFILYHNNDTSAKGLIHPLPVGRGLLNHLNPRVNFWTFSPFGVPMKYSIHAKESSIILIDPHGL